MTGSPGRTSTSPVWPGPTRPSQPTTRAPPVTACACSTNISPIPSRLDRRAMRVDFYQLGEASAESVIAALGGKLVAEGQRLLVTASDEALLARLDRMLWDQGATSFVPHGLAGSGDDAAQPILLSQG